MIIPQMLAVMFTFNTGKSLVVQNCHHIHKPASRTQPLEPDSLTHTLCFAATTTVNRFSTEE